jgi:hypothetical protein
MESTTNRLDQVEERIPRIKDQVEELLLSNSNKEKKIITTTFKTSMA